MYFYLFLGKTCLDIALVRHYDEWNIVELLL